MPKHKNWTLRHKTWDLNSQVTPQTQEEWRAYAHSLSRKAKRSSKDNSGRILLRVGTKHSELIEELKALGYQTSCDTYARAVARNDQVVMEIPTKNTPAGALKGPSVN